ncbi:MAG: alpha/beta hydrolase [Planctomycetales bacterium]|nr:alpha/beta hydrolase [Planctomycetales bacterium]
MNKRLRGCSALGIVAVWQLSLGIAPAQEARTLNADRLAKARTEVYKTVGETQLKLFVFTPPGHQASDKRPAVVFFFGGGWNSGSPGQFAPHSERLAARGMVAICADYRVNSRHKAQVKDCVTDAKSAIRWVRSNAAKLGIDPNRIAAGGGSAGGHLAAAVATLDGFDEKTEDASISSRPNSLLLFNPALDLTPDGFGRKADEKKADNFRERLGAEAKALSPAHNIKSGGPPTILFHGRADTTVPFKQAEEFARRMKEAGNRCDLVGYEGQPHGFFNFGRNENKFYDDTLAKADAFLVSLGWLEK